MKMIVPNEYVHAGAAPELVKATVIAHLVNDDGRHLGGVELFPASVEITCHVCGQQGNDTVSFHADSDWDVCVPCLNGINSAVNNYLLPAVLEPLPIKNH